MSQYPVRGYVFSFISYVEKLKQKSLSDLTEVWQSLDL